MLSGLSVVLVIKDDILKKEINVHLCILNMALNINALIHRP
jgi:hypothetical protein